MSSPLLEQFVTLASVLSVDEKIELVGELMDQIRSKSEPPKTLSRSLQGALDDLGPAPSAEDIDEMRREVWANFPKDPDL